MNRLFQLVLIAAFPLILVGDREQSHAERGHTIDYAAANAHAEIKGYSSSQRREIELDRRLFRTSMMSSEMLLRWIDIGDPELWMIYLFGEDGTGGIRPEYLGGEKVKETYYDVRGQGVIRFTFEREHLTKIDFFYVCFPEAGAMP